MSSARPLVAPANVSSDRIYTVGDARETIDALADRLQSERIPKRAVMQFRLCAKSLLLGAVEIATQQETSHVPAESEAHADDFIDRCTANDDLLITGARTALFSQFLLTFYRQALEEASPGTREIYLW